MSCRLQEYFEDKHVGLSIPSLRVDQQLQLVPKLFTSVRKSGLTIAVEAAGERLRQIINKPLKDSDLFAAVEEAYKAGWEKLKLYFMVGLPGETLDDVKDIVDLSCRLATLRRRVDGKTGSINITVSWFVPKPHTPFGWLPQRPREYFEQARQIIIDEKLRLRAKFLMFKFHEINQSILEAAMGRGDRRYADIIEAAWRHGARFDLWDDCFNYALWREAFARVRRGPRSGGTEIFRSRRNPALGAPRRTGQAVPADPSRRRAADRTAAQFVMSGKSERIQTSNSNRAGPAAVLGAVDFGFVSDFPIRTLDFRESRP